MSVYRQKVIRDFWQERARSILVILAIAVGVSAFLTVLSSYAVLTRELDRGYLVTNPASFTLVTDRIDEELMSALSANRGVSAAEPRRILSGRIKVGTAEWRNLRLFVVPDYGDVRVGRLRPQAGAWPPATGEILIERNALPVARANIGDTAIVKTAGGHEQTLRISGTVHDVGQAQAQMENLVYGYLTLETLATLGEEPYLDRLNVVVAGDRFDERHIRDVADEVKRLVEGQGRPVHWLDVPPPGRHPHSAIMGLLMLTMAGFGLLALLLSGVIVVNLLTALMAGQTRQIGVMKALGGTRRQIARIYLAQSLLLGSTAVLVALPVGIWGGRALSRYLSVFLNFDIISLAGPVWVYLLVIVVGLLVPLSAAAYPVWRGSGVSVREALSDYGAARNSFGATAFDRALAGLGGPARPLLFAVRNGFRRRSRLALTLLTLSASGLFFMSALNVRSSIINTLDRLFATRQFDLSVNLGEMIPLEKVERALRETPGVLQAEGWIFAEGAVPNPREGSGEAPAEGARSQGRRFNVIALPAETRLLKPEIVQGRNLLPDETGAMVANTALAEKLPQLQVGSEMVLRIGSEQKSWQIVGVAREPFSSATAYIPLRYLELRDGRMANTLRLALEKTDPASIELVKTALERNLEQEGVRTARISGKADNRFIYDQHMLMIYVFLIIMSGLLAAVGGLGVMTTMSLNVLERRREMGVLRAIGATPGIVGLIVVVEGCVAGLLSWALAASVAWPFSKALGDLLVTLMLKSRPVFLFELKGLWLWLAISLILCAAASLLPAWRASRQSVREALGYE
ncbi:MAG TPA: FtsX-like permease family protein [Blastocatellia bacterium]|nr:FtsX-like permease family protein [Blastocatellia bacterium]